MFGNNNKWEFSLREGLRLCSGFRHQPLLTLLRYPQLNDFIKWITFHLRWMLPIAFLCRFLLHSDRDKETFPPFTAPEIFMILFILFVIYLALSEIKYSNMHKENIKDAHKWRVFASIFSLIDIIFISFFYLLAKNPRSDVPFLYIIPIIWANIFMPIRNNLWTLICVGIAFPISVVLVSLMGGSSLAISELILVLMPKVIIFPLVMLYVIWINFNEKLGGNIISTLFDKSGDGISFVGQKSNIIKQKGPIVDMQLLKINSAQQSLTPKATVNAGSCWKEFRSKSINVDSECLWCPVINILKGTAQHQRSLTTLNTHSTDDEMEELSFYDVNASPCYDEKGEVIAAVKFSRDVTPQLYAVHLVTGLLRSTKQEEIMTRSVKFFRKMFKGNSAKLVLLENIGNDAFTLSLQAEATKEHPSGTIIGGQPISISSRGIKTLRDSLSEIEILEKETCNNFLSWDNYRLPSYNEHINEIAYNFDTSYGLITPIKKGENLWGLILTSTSEKMSRSLTQLDIVQAQLAAQTISIALERIQSIETKSQTSATFKQLSEAFFQLRILCGDISKFSDSDKMLGLCLFGITSKLGLGYTRCLYLELNDSQLRFKFGIGPITNKEALELWKNDKATNINEYYKDTNWFDNIVNNRISKIGQSQPSIKIENIKASVIYQSIKHIESCKGNADDDFIKNTSLASAIRIENEFAVSPVFSQGIVHGIMIADKTYSDNENIDPAEIGNLMFLTSFVGSCSEGSKLITRFKNYASDILHVTHDVIQNRLTSDELNNIEMVNLVEKVAQSLKLSEEEIMIAKIAAIGVALAHIAMPDSVLLSECILTKEDDLYKQYILQHPVNAHNFVHKIQGSEDSAIAAYDHHVLFDKYPLEKNEICITAKLLGIIEAYMALTKPKKYKKKQPMSVNQAISELHQVIKNEEDMVILEALNSAVSVDLSC